MFTTLETTLISLVTAFVACVMMFVSLGRIFQTRSGCLANHQVIRIMDADVCGSIKKIENSQTLQFMMLREIITYMDLPSDTKTKILNMQIPRM